MQHYNSYFGKSSSLMVYWHYFATRRHWRALYIPIQKEPYAFGYIYFCTLCLLLLLPFVMVYLFQTYINPCSLSREVTLYWIWRVLLFTCCLYVVTCIIIRDIVILCICLHLMANFCLIKRFKNISKVWYRCSVFWS